MSLIAWYPLNGDLLDYSGNDNHLENHGAILNDNGKIGRCYEFAGDGDWTSSIDDISYVDVSFCAWVYPMSFTYLQGVVSSHVHSSTANIGMNISDGRLTVSLGYTDGTREFNSKKSNSVLSSNVWSHIIITFNKKDNEIRFYINGVFDRRFILEKEVKFIKSGLCVGNWSMTYLNNHYDFIGRINDVRIYNHTLSDKEILEISKAKILHYTFNTREESTRNLYTNRNRFSSSNVTTTWDGEYSVEFDTAGSTSGIYFNSNMTITANKTYTFSYKFQKVSGTLKNIRGHIDSNNWTHVLTLVDGVSRSGAGTISMVDDSKIHTVSVTLTAKSTATSLYYNWIQPNYGDTTAMRVRIFDIQVEEKGHATDFVIGDRLDTVYDSSGYNNHSELSLTSTPKWVEDSAIGVGSYYFEERQFISTNNTTITKLQEFTYSCWINTSDNSAFLLMGGRCGNNTYISMAMMSGKLCLHTYGYTEGTNTDKNYALGTTLLNDSSWHHCVVSFKNGIVKTYVDGKLEAEQSNVVFRYSTSSYFTLNYDTLSSIGDSFESRRFIGQLADVRVYATALVDESIAWLYKNRASLDDRGNLSARGFKEIDSTVEEGHTKLTEQGIYESNEFNTTGTTNGLTRWYKLDKDLYDYSFSMVDGIESGEVLKDYQEGYDCHKFTNSHIDCGQAYIHSTGSICCWIKANREYPSDDSETIVWRSIVGKVDGEGVGQQGYYLDWHGKTTTRVLRFGIGNEERGDNVIYNDVDLREWTHVCGTQEEGEIKLYINGELVSQKQTMILCQACDEPLKIGNFFNAWDGWIRDVRVYQTTLNLEEIARIYKLSEVEMQIGDNHIVYVKNQLLEG